MTKLNMSELNTVNGGYVFQSDFEKYEIIRDSDGEVLLTYDVPIGLKLLDYCLTKTSTDRTVMALAIAYGQSPKFIGWDKLNELRWKRK